jgi:hypothetical protein
MKFTDIKKVAVTSAFGLVALLGTSVAANAQWGQNEQERVYQQQQRDAERIAEQQRARQDQINRQNDPYYNNSRYNNNGRRNRYRVNRNGRYYNMDQRGAELLRQAVNAGYQQGYNAGRQDSRSRRRNSWNNNSMYNSGTYGYQSYVDRNLYQYYFRQGFEKGYQDGFSSRNQYGRNGTNILGTILNSILNIQTY